MNLQTRYNRDEFLQFVRTFVPGFTQNIRTATTDKLQVTTTVTFLGETDELDLSVFEISHSSSADARVALSMDGFKVMKTSGAYRALIVYKSDNSDDWRLSLMTATPDISEKGKVIQQLSNPRRFSFFLGPNAKINTPHQFLIRQGAVANFEDLQQRFSLEVVNKEFYKQISEQFTKLVGGTTGVGRGTTTWEPLLQLPSQSPKSQICLEFAVRLIGRVIFCWFLREKKSQNGVPLMPNELLSLDAIAGHPQYYHSVLEPIFFEMLNKEQKTRRDAFLGEPYSFIPYLNGGLFSAHPDDYYKRPNGEQSLYHDTLVVPDQWLKELFTILETYNFTIDENTSFDEELSIDPEMLGRIFENLLAEINPETGESARKSTGSYYTPRVIVDYMVDETLYLYLKEHTKILENKLRSVISYDLTDDADHPFDDAEKQKIVDTLGRLKLLDPACGSGAFPIGALQKIVFILQQVDPEGKLWLKKQLEKAHPEFRRDIEKKFSNKELDFLRKLGIIRECIFGVDIQPIATEIARLRCFLTLIVDERINDAAENRGIKPLPNLDFKFVTANSLIDLPNLDEQSQSAMFDDREKIDELKNIRDQYFNAYGIEREQLKTEFVTAQKKLIDQLVTEHGYMGVLKAELTQKLSSWEPFSHKSSSWFDPEWMFGVKGFDIIMANPPYVGEKGHKELFQHVKKNSTLRDYYLGKMDLFYFFFHLALNLGKETSQIAFITTNYYPTALGARKLRKDFNSRGIIRYLINFNELKIFQSAKGQHNMITIISRGNDRDVIAKTCITKRQGESSSQILNTIVNWEDDLTDYCEVAQDDLYDGEECYVRLFGKHGSAQNPIHNILENIKRQGTLLGELCRINNGIHSQADYLSNMKYSDRDDQSAEVGDGIYVLDCCEAKDLKIAEMIESNAVEKAHLQPFFKNSDVYCYCTKIISSKKIIYINKQLDDIDQLPEIKKHLSRFKKIIDKASDNAPYLHRPKTYSDFIGKKIVAPQRSRTNTFGFNEVPWFASADVYFITEKDKSVSLKYVLALLNSKLYYLWLYHKGKRKGELLELYQQPLSEIPIKHISFDQQKEIINAVNDILSITSASDFDPDNPLPKLKALQEKIDNMVCDLYELSRDEKQLVLTS